MGAKIVLTGQAKDIQRQERIVSFHIVTGPAARQPPRGLKLFGQTHYYVECTTRQWRRARQHPNDNSELNVEGYLEPRRDPETGQLFIAVTAVSVQSTLLQNAHKLEQLEQVLRETREAFKQAHKKGVSRAVLEERAAAFVKASDSVDKFLTNHPELISEKSI
jgi:hypothetical protein